MKHRRFLVAGAALFCLLAVVMGVIWRHSCPETEIGEKHIIVEVIHKDKTEKVFEYQTDHAYLGELLLETDLITGTNGEYGLFVEAVDGETADYSVDQGWWQLSCNGERAQTGADSIVLHNGDRYTWTYMVG